MSIHLEQKWTESKEETVESIITVGEVNTLLSLMDKITRQKENQ